MYLHITPEKAIMKRSHLKEIFWVMVGQAGSMLATLATIKALTSFLPPATYGELNLLLVAMLLPSSLLLAPLSQAAIRWYPAQREKGALADLLWTTIPAYLAVSVASSAIGLGLLGLGLLDGLGFQKIVLGLAISIFFVDSLISMGLSLASAARQRKHVALITVLTSWARLFFMLVGFKVFGNSLTVFLWGYFIGSAFILCYVGCMIFAEFKKAGRGKASGSLLRGMMSYGVPFGIWGGFAWIQQYVDRYLVEVTIDIATAGAYIASLQVAALPFNLAGGLLSQFLTPIIYDHFGDGSDVARMQSSGRILFKIVGLFILIGILTAVLYWAFGSWIMSFFTHKNYVLSSSILFALALGALSFNAAQQLTLLLLAQNLSHQLMWAKIIPGVVSIPIIWSLAKIFGVFGVSIGYLTVNLIYLLIVLILIKKSAVSQSLIA